MRPIDQLGGEAKLREIMEEFVGRCFEDPMIGFFFRDANQRRIEELEYQHAAEWLGADVRYRGRELGDAHHRHRIMGGQFARRLQILREVLAKHQVPQDLAQAWIAHQEALRPRITKDPGSECR